MSTIMLSSHSSKIEMWLEHSDNQKAKLARISKSTAVLFVAAVVPIGDAKLIITVDGQEHSKKVYVANQSKDHKVVLLKQPLPF